MHQRIFRRRGPAGPSLKILIEKTKNNKNIVIFYCIALDGISTSFIRQFCTPRFGSRISDFGSQIPNLKSRNSDLDSRGADLKSRIWNIKIPISHLESQIPDLESCISNLESRSSNLGFRISKLVSRIICKYRIIVIFHEKYNILGIYYFKQKII